MEVRTAFFFLFIMHVHYINNETYDFLGAQENNVRCKKLEWLCKQCIVPLSVSV